MAERAVSPRSVVSVPDLVERPDGLWEYHGKTLEDHIAVWRDIDAKVESAQWAMAAIAASLTIKYGKGQKGQENVKQFAEAVGRSEGYIWKMARTWIYWTNANCPQGHFEDLTFSHHVRAITHGDPVEAMNVARDRGFSAIGLEEWISDVAVENVDKPKRKASKKEPERENEYKVWLERLDSALLKDFIPTCPNKEFARRVLAREWREIITWELREINRSENRDLILAAIEEGAHTEDDLRKVTRLRSSEISGVIGALVSEGLYEWVREGGETDMARGSRRAILHRVGTPVFT